ncbi:uncharacterized protein PG986_000580 [Apiospora aurea]|uniref:2EXR domain-containing protein n=1 Tax=Apiospora aurea TaxID=335848 RepID=A0ABR1QV20_9PEZI
MSQFHPFPRLPPELRQQIWQLSLEPRELIIRSNNLSQTALQAKPPAQLHACHESRAYLAGRLYVQAFRTKQNANLYDWVNFDADIIYANSFSLGRLSDQKLARTQRLVLAGVDSFFFLNQHYDELRRRMPALRDATVLSRGLDGVLEETWLDGWAQGFFKLYHNEKEGAVSIYLRTLAPHDRKAWTAAELNPDNYYEQWRIMHDRGFPVVRIRINRRR